MELELSDEQLELRDNVRQVLEGISPPAVVRAVYEEGASADPVWAQMVELYWPGVAIAEALGGLGLGYVELALVAEELGRAVAPGPFLATATQFAPLVREAGSDAQQATFLAAVAEGTITGTVALAEGDRYELSAVHTAARRSSDGWVLDGRKTSVFDGATADEIAVVARAEGVPGDDGIGVFVVPGTAVKADARAVMDPTLPLADVQLDNVVVGDDRVLAAPGDGRAARAVERAHEEAVVALAFTTVGACRLIFEATLQYAKDRVQYGKPIGSFQAIKHRLADMFLSIERATALCYYAALTIAEDDPRRAEAASLAKAAAGDCQRLLAQEGLQLHGGIGYTWEHDLHFLLKRAKSGGALLGTSAAHRARLAQLLGLVPA